MRFPWSKAHREEQRKLRDAEKRLAEVRGQWLAVHQGAAEMRVHHQRNHFADSIRTIFKEDR